MTKSRGIKRLLREGRKQFRTEENTAYYSNEDFREAERRFLIECVLKDRCGLWNRSGG